MSSEKEPRRRLSCSACFDALWFCYTPVHQMQQYYRLGKLDNCSNKWSALYDCLRLKTKSQAEVEVRIETDPADRTQLRMTVASGDPTVTFELKEFIKEQLIVIPTAAPRPSAAAAAAAEVPPHPTPAAAVSADPGAFLAGLL